MLFINNHFLCTIFHFFVSIALLQTTVHSFTFSIFQFMSCHNAACCIYNLSFLQVFRDSLTIREVWWCYKLPFKLHTLMRYSIPGSHYLYSRMFSKLLQQLDLKAVASYLIKAPCEQSKREICSLINESECKISFSQFHIIMSWKIRVLVLLHPTTPWGQYINNIQLIRTTQTHTLIGAVHR